MVTASCAGQWHSVAIENLTSGWTGVAPWGPKAQDVLMAVAEEDVFNKAFPYFTAQSIKIGSIAAFAARLSYAGESGWEIYCTSEYGLNLWDTLWEVGEAHGIFALGNA